MGSRAIRPEASLRAALLGIESDVQDSKIDLVKVLPKLRGLLDMLRDLKSRNGTASDTKKLN